MCGEKFRVLEMDRTLKGSPPRVRGEDDFHGVCAVRFRITPACAGRSRRRPGAPRTTPDHPRVCGEKPQSDALGVGHIGSPPRVRGEEFRFETVQSGQRITPACAGRRTGRILKTTIFRDHPRVCGEKLRGAGVPQKAQGSPPRVRGEAGRARPCTSLSGITPACAGRSKKLFQPRFRGGEKGDDISMDLACKGSPPRVRGEDSDTPQGSIADRITPACAGRSSAMRRKSCFQKDHPRVCGEKELDTCIIGQSMGSPPRVRGEAGSYS